MFLKQMPVQAFRRIEKLLAIHHLAESLNEGFDFRCVFKIAIPSVHLIRRDTPAALSLRREPPIQSLIYSPWTGLDMENPAAN